MTEKKNPKTGKAGTVSMVNKINPRLIKFFEALSNETRLTIVAIISEKPLTVNELYEKLSKTPVRITLSGLSHQLKTLSELDIIIMKKKGREKYCMLSDKFCWCMVKDAFKHFNQEHKCSKCCQTLTI